MNEDGLEALWRHVEAGWDDPARHGVFLETARATDGLPEAAARYRAVVEAGGPRADDAKKRLAAIALLAIGALEAAKSPRRTKPPTWLTVLVVIATVLVVFGMARLLGK